jgi:hypothetical protein
MPHLPYVKCDEHQRPEGVSVAPTELTAGLIIDRDVARTKHWHRLPFVMPRPVRFIGRLLQRQKHGLGDVGMG